MLSATAARRIYENKVVPNMRDLSLAVVERTQLPGVNHATSSTSNFSVRGFLHMVEDRRPRSPDGDVRIYVAEAVLWAGDVDSQSIAIRSGNTLTAGSLSFDVATVESNYANGTGASDYSDDTRVSYTLKLVAGN